MRFAWIAVPLLAMTACGDDAATPDAGAAIDAPAVPDATPDAIEPDANTIMPERLRDTGLYEDFANETLADGVREFHPSFELWSDSATKRRFVLLPPGSQIDSSNMDFWQYPVGTKLWKEFVRDNVRVETRLLQKNGPERQDWYMMAYVWNEAQTEALAAPDGATDVLGTDHDVPETADCQKCHDRMPDIAVGFSALLLDHQEGGLNLDALVTGGLLTNNPPGAFPYFEIPGDPTERAALGYMHVNCGNCHHSLSDVMDKVLIDMRLRPELLGSVQETPVFTTGVGVAHELNMGPSITALIEPGDPAASAVTARMNLRDGDMQMPPIGSEQVDAPGTAAIEAWISALP